MNTISRWFGVLGGVCMGSVAWAQIPPPPPDWPITSAPARFVIEPDHLDKPVSISWVNLCLPDPKWLAAPLRVFTDTGIAVGSDLLWSAPGEPVTLLFDSSSNAKRYYVYPGSNWPAVHLDNNKAGVLLESRAGDGKQIDHLPDMLQAWNQSATVYGRAMVQGLFEGGHRFGPQGNILEHFQGWFETANPEHLELAAISNDASFVLVDGKQVVEWPGRHDFRPGLGGQFQGAVDLPAGMHLLDYYNAYVSNERDHGHPLLCCLAAKGGTLAQWTMLTPDNAFFKPTGHAHVTDYGLQVTTTGVATGGDAPACVIDWAINNQSVIGPEIPDLGLIAMQLTCRPANISSVTWTFDDGTTAKGQSVLHVFPRPGMRTVQVEASEGDKSIKFTQVISVHPNWTQLTTFQPQLVPEHQNEIMGRDPAVMSASDLASCVAVFAVFKNSGGLLKILPVVCDKLKDFNEADLPYVREAGMFLAREDLSHFAEASQLLRALVGRCTQDNASPQLVILGSQSRLGLAQITLKTTDHLDEVKALLAAIKVETLTNEEPRQLNILRADLALANGDVAGARKQYADQTGDPSGPDARSSIRRTARIGQARTFMERKDFEAAENALNEVAWQAPIEKISQDWDLTRLRLYQEQGLPVAAYLWAKRLLPVINDSGRSELLFRLTDLAFTQGDNDLAQKSLSELLKKHPYSSEAAQAKEKWPGKG